MGEEEEEKSGRMLRGTTLSGLASKREVEKTHRRTCHESSDLENERELTM